MGPGAGLLSPVLAALPRQDPAAQRRMYVLAEMAGPATAPPVAAALVETEPAGYLARLRALVVASPYRGRGFGRRLLGDLLSELRAEGVRRVRYQPEPEDGELRALLLSAGFIGEPTGPKTVPATPVPDMWLVRDL